MYNYVGLKKNDEALVAADQFFNKSDKPEFTYFDYTYYGQALRAKKQFDLAVGQYEKAYQLDTTKIELLKEISDMYSEKGDYQNAILTYSKYVNKLTPENKNADTFMTLGKMYTNLGSSDSIAIDKKKIALMNADSLFSQVAVLEPINYRANYWRARVNSALDPETTLGLAKPYYEQTATLIESKADPRYNSVLIECYSYLGYYSLLQKDNPLSLSYWNKILVIDPANATAIKAITGITKTMKVKK
jgi:tetratricopeptide (TPR) repeat protein